MKKQNDISWQHLYYRDKKKIEVKELVSNNKITRRIFFSSLSPSLKKELIKELHFFIKQVFNFSKFSILIVGLGNEEHTADAIGPKTVKKIVVNSHLTKLGIENLPIKVSALEPGVMATTGIDTQKIIKSVVKEIKPDLVLLIDSFVTDTLSFLNQTIEIVNDGVIPGSGVKGLNEKIDARTLGVPVMLIGVPTALIYQNDYLLSKSDIDNYVKNMSDLLSSAINTILYST